MTPLDYFRVFVTDELTTHLVHETNIYAKQSRENVPGRENTKSQWLEVTISEMWKFLSLLFWTGIIKKPTLSSYWSTNPLLATPFFSSVMSRDRFYSILRYFHFNNNATRPEDCTDRLYKVRPIYDMLIEKFKTVYTPGEHLSLDEGMLKWRGRLLFKVYNPQKPEQYGMKAYILCETKSGYLCNCTLYRGVHRTVPEISERLLEPLYNRYHKLYMDNFYNSVHLSENLLQHQILTCGTLRIIRGFPKTLRQEAEKLKKGDIAFRRKNAVIVMAWKDKRLVKMVSTFHDASMADSGKQKSGNAVMKSICILDYNRYMSGVDHLDQTSSYYSCARKTVEWSKKLVLHLLHLAVMNGFILYKKYNGGITSVLDFLMAVIRDMLHVSVEATESEATDSAPTQAFRAARTDPPTRLIGSASKHKLAPIPADGGKTFHKKLCRVCSRKKKRSETRYYCEDCKIPVHKGECYNAYHSKKYYWL